MNFKRKINKIRKKQKQQSGNTKQQNTDTNTEKINQKSTNRIMKIRQLRKSETSEGRAKGKAKNKQQISKSE